MDREKVISGIERCLVCETSVIATEEGQKAYLECEYTTGLYCRRDNLLRDALALLKEQEAVEPHQAEAVIWHGGTEHIYLIDTCGACNERIEEDAVFCSRCGRRILWKGR